MKKSIEELNIQLKNVRNADELILLLKDTIDNSYYLVHHNKYAPLGCQNLSNSNYDIALDDNKNKFIVYEFMEGTKTRFYKTMYKYFTIQKAEIIAYDIQGNPDYIKVKYNIIDDRDKNIRM